MTLRAERTSKSDAVVRSLGAGLLGTRLDTSQAFPRHMHDSYGIGRLFSGAQRSWSAAGWVEAGPGDVLMVNPCEVHDGAPLGGGARRWSMLYIEPALVLQAAAEVLPPNRVPPMWRPVARDARLAMAFERWYVRLDANAGRLSCEEAQTALLARLLLAQAGLAAPRLANPALCRARQRLDDDPATDPGLEALATDAGLSRFQFLRAFASTYGITPHAYLVQRRLMRARALLTSGSTIADAALAAGFSDQSHLSRTFKRCWGHSPALHLGAARRTPGPTTLTL